MKLWWLLPVGVRIRLMALSQLTHQAKSLPMRKHRHVRSILIYLVFLKFIQPAPMDIEEELLSDDLYNVSAGQHLQVATLDFSFQKTFQTPQTSHYYPFQNLKLGISG